MTLDTPLIGAPGLHESALTELLELLPQAHSVVLAQTDGFEVASAMRRAVPAARLAALASSMLALGEAALRELGMGGHGNVLIEGTDGKLLLLEVPLASQPLVLAVVAGEDAITGSLLWAARQCVQRIINHQ